MIIQYLQDDAVAEDFGISLQRRVILKAGVYQLSGFYAVRMTRNWLFLDHSQEH